MIGNTFSECESLGLNDFPTAERLQWHGHAPLTPNWSESSRFVAFTLVCMVMKFYLLHLSFLAYASIFKLYRLSLLLTFLIKSPYLTFIFFKNALISSHE